MLIDNWRLAGKLEFLAAHARALVLYDLLSMIYYRIVALCESPDDHAAFVIPHDPWKVAILAPMWSHVVALGVQDYQ